MFFLSVAVEPVATAVEACSPSSAQEVMSAVAVAVAVFVSSLDTQLPRPFP